MDGKPGSGYWKPAHQVGAHCPLIMPYWKIGALLVFLVGVRVDFLLLKKKTFSCYTCIAALVSLINNEYIYLHLDFLLLKKNFLLLHLHSSPSFTHQ